MMCLGHAIASPYNGLYVRLGSIRWPWCCWVVHLYQRRCRRLRRQMATVWLVVCRLWRRQFQPRRLLTMVWLCVRRHQRRRQQQRRQLQRILGEQFEKILNFLRMLCFALHLYDVM